MSLQTNTASLMALLESVNALPDRVDTSGTATAADIYTGKTATVNDTKLTGTNPYNAANVDPAVASILSALTEKGVDTTGAGLADIAALVAGIQAGEAKVAYGTLIPSEDLAYYDIPHNLGEIPNFAVILPAGSMPSSNGYVCLLMPFEDKNQAAIYGYNGSYFTTSFKNKVSLAGDADTMQCFFQWATETTISTGRNRRNDGLEAALKSGIEYWWAVGVI